MKIAVLADIHGNYVALERCLEDAFAQNIDTFFFLGDYIGELAYPERTMQMLYDLYNRYQCYFIRGNKEEYWLNYRAEGEKGWKDKNSASGALYYSYHNLTERDLDFYAKLRTVQEVTLGEMPAITICHGSPDKVNEKIESGTDRTIEIMNRITTSIILCGHSHVQRKIVHNEKRVLNPGSVGMPLFSDGRTQYLILQGTEGRWEEEFISLDYDIERVIREMQEAKLYIHAPHWSLISEHVLREGLLSHNTVLTRSMELCKEEAGDCIWPDIPERCWAQAVDEIIYKRKQ